MWKLYLTNNVQKFIFVVFYTETNFTHISIKSFPWMHKQERYECKKEYVTSEILHFYEVVLTGNSRDQFEGSQNSHRPQSPQIHRDVHVSPGCSQDPTQQVNTSAASVQCFGAKNPKRSALLKSWLQVCQNRDLYTWKVCWQTETSENKQDAFGS